FFRQDPVHRVSMQDPSRQARLGRSAVAIHILQDKDNMCPIVNVVLREIDPGVGKFCGIVIDRFGDPAIEGIVVKLNIFQRRGGRGARSFHHLGQ
ncbi:MAG: hypothetical protein ACK56I_13665, partial [bacterium]